MQDAQIQECFERIYSEYSPYMINYCRWRGMTPEVANDLVHLAFTKVWKNRRNLDWNGGMKSYLTKTLASILTDYHRKKYHTQEIVWLAKDENDEETRELLEEVPADEPSPEDLAIHAEHKEVCGNILASLPARWREPLVLYYHEGRSYTEIAEILSVPEGTVKSCMHRGKVAAAQRYKKYIASRKRT